VISRRVLLHGWGFTPSVFSSFRGFKPYLTDGPFRSWYELVARLASRLDRGHEVVGWSMGGAVAVLLAYFFPKKVSRLVLVGTSPFFGGAWEKKNLRAFKARLKREGVGFFHKLAVGRELEAPPLELLTGYLEAFLELDLRPLLPHLRHEVVVVQGLDDAVVPVKEAYALKRLLKRSKLILLPGGHLPIGHEAELDRLLYQSG